MLRRALTIMSAHDTTEVNMTRNELISSILNDEVTAHGALVAVVELGRDREGDDDAAFYEQQTRAIERLLDDAKASLRG